MPLSPERRARMAEELRATSKFHGEFKYPEACYPFADLAQRQTIERPPVDGHPYTVDLFTAHNRRPNCPVHVNIHGGGFVCRHQINDSLWCAWLADQIQGIVVDVIYSLSDEAVWPTCLDQCLDAAYYAHRHCAAWGGDPKRVSVGGYSAGGMLTMGVGLKARQAGDLPLCLLVNGYGPSRMEIDPDLDTGGDYWRTPAGRNAAFADLLFDGDFAAAKDPFFAIDYADDEQLRGLPHTVIAAGGLCPFRQQNQQLGLRLASLGVEVTMKTFPGAVHGFIPHFMDHWQEGAEMIVRCLRSATL